MKKIVSMALALMLVVSMLTGCSDIKMEELAGTWVTVKADTQEEAMGLLENIEAYEEEIALTDLDSLEYVKVVGFNEDGTYYFGYDVEGTMACVRDFYDRYFKALYEGRTALNEAYGETFDEMSEGEFRQFYADLYGYVDYIEMLDTFAEIAYDYEALEEPLETGRFTIDGDDLMCTIDGEYEAESLGAAVEEGVLTLTYSDGVEVYSRAN